MTKCYKKKCLKCKSCDVKKDGSRRGKQSYKCKKCGYIWISKSRKSANRDKENELLYRKFAIHKQTYKELSKITGLHPKTIQKRLDEYIFKKPVNLNSKDIILLVDTTYFGDYGVMVLKDTITGNILGREIVSYETNEMYRIGINKLIEQGYIIKAIVCDGRRGLLGMFPDIPMQMCHFHQIQIIRKCITKKPKTEANKDLQKIVKWLTRTHKECFESELQNWYEKHKGYINEQGFYSNGKKYYIHRKTRTAYYSLKRNLKYLFTYLDYLHEIDIPNTTNGLEGLFGQLKYKVTLHRGLRKDRKQKLIQYLLDMKTI